MGEDHPSPAAKFRGLVFESWSSIVEMLQCAPRGHHTRGIRLGLPSGPVGVNDGASLTHSPTAVLMRFSVRNYPQASRCSSSDHVLSAQWTAVLARAAAQHAITRTEAVRYDAHFRGL
jgi:hypothetical protein